MKRIGFIGVAAVIAIGGLTVTATPASAQKPWMVRSCQTSVNSGSFKTMGECLAFLRAGAVSYCTAQENAGEFDKPNPRWRNKHICIRDFQLRR